MTTDIVNNGFRMRFQVYLIPQASGSQVWFLNQQQQHHLGTARNANSWAPPKLLNVNIWR